MSEPVEGEVVNPGTGVVLTKLTKHDENVVLLLEAAFHNAYNITEACEYAGISRTTFYEWLADDDIFSMRMSIAQGAPSKKAKEIVILAIKNGDSSLALRYLMLRDPDFKPKVGIEPDPEAVKTRQKIKEFLDDKSPDDEREQPVATADTEPRGEVANAPTDIS